MYYIKFVWIENKYNYFLVYVVYFYVSFLFELHMAAYLIMSGRFDIFETVTLFNILYSEFCHL